MKFDLKTPCKNCPFGIAETRIRFSGLERAAEIAEQAYRNGFPCHLSAEYVEDDEGDSDGYVFGRNTQHCAGAAGMFINDLHDSWPGIGNDSDLAEQIAERMGSDGLAACFDSEQDFLDANTKGN